MFAIVEKFISINGEGPSAGRFAVFIRLAECNLRCSWCDTKYALNKTDATSYEKIEDIVLFVKNSGLKLVTITGGEPLLHTKIGVLLEKLSCVADVEIETNGSIDISKFNYYKNVKFIVDYKLPSSTMEDKMCLKNFENLCSDDACKFVIADKIDLDRAIQIVKLYNLPNVYFGNVFDGISMAEIVERLKKEKLYNVRVQLQLHKYIWHKDIKGV